MNTNNLIFNARLAQPEEDGLDSVILVTRYGMITSIETDTMLFLLVPSCLKLGNCQ